MSQRIAKFEPWLPTALAVILAGIPLATWSLSVGNLGEYFAFQVPPGQLLYLASKLSALAGLVLISVQLAFGLSGLVTPRPANAAAAFPLHRALGITTLLVVLAHALLFVVAASLRNQNVMLGYLWPDFSHGYYRSMVSIGAIALIGVLVTVFAGVLRWQRKRLGQWLHWVSVPTYVLIWIHSLTIGSESRMGLMPYVYGLLALLVATALFYRMRVLSGFTQ